jgi:hypothetical protein
MMEHQNLLVLRRESMMFSAALKLYVCLISIPSSISTFIPILFKIYSIFALSSTLAWTSISLLILLMIFHCLIRFPLLPISLTLLQSLVLLTLIPALLLVDYRWGPFTNLFFLRSNKVYHPLFHIWCFSYFLSALFSFKSIENNSSNPAAQAMYELLQAESQVAKLDPSNLNM